MKLRWWKTADEMADDFARNVEPQTDEEFLASLGLPQEGRSAFLALAVRHSIAEYGMINSAFIHADHGYPNPLSELSGWDSLDFVGWIFILEKALGQQVGNHWFSSLRREFTVRDLVQAVQQHADDAA